MLNLHHTLQHRPQPGLMPETVEQVLRRSQTVKHLISLNILKNQVLIGVVELHVSLCPSWPSYVSSSKDKREGTPIQVSSSLWLPYLMLIQWLSIIGPTM